MKLFVENLNIFNTLNCNFKCAHCMLGETTNQNISREVLEKIFESIKIVQVLTFIGGESFMNPQALRDTLEIIKRDKVAIYKLEITTNGSLYNDEIESILDEYEEYIEMCRREIPECNFMLEGEKIVGIIFSADEYHRQYMNQLETSNPDLANKYYKNMERLFASKHFYCPRDTSSIFKIGKASSLKEAFDEVDNYKGFYYEEDDIMYAGACVNIFTDGTLTEHNGSIEDFKTRFNYGNILETNLEDLIRNALEKCDTIEQFDDKKNTEIDRFNALSEENYRKKMRRKKIVKRKNRKTYLT